MLLKKLLLLPKVKISRLALFTGMKKYLRCDKCGKYLPLIPALLNQFTGATRAPGGGAHEEGEENLLNAQNTEKSVSAITAPEIFISTSSE